MAISIERLTGVTLQRSREFWILQKGAKIESSPLPIYATEAIATCVRLSSMVSPTGVVLGNAGIASSSRRRDLWPRLQPVLDICEERRVQSHDEFSSSSETQRPPRPPFEGLLVTAKECFSRN